MTAKRVDREGPIHVAILRFLRLALPGAVIHHSPNAIGLSGVQIERQISKARHMGTVKGFPDLIVLSSHGTFLFEVKALGNYADADQRDLHTSLRDMGYPVFVVRSPEDAEAALRSFSVPLAASLSSRA